MWIVYACGSALFAGLTSILAKCGIKDTDSDVATAIRTIVVLIFSWLMVYVTGTFNRMVYISGKTLVFLVLSGMATGISWLCYFKALQLGDVNKVMPVDKSSTILTMLMAYILLGEQFTWLKLLAMILIGAGTFWMIQKKEGSVQKAGDSRWLIYAAGSAVFASLTSILGKVGIEGTDSDLGTAIRTIIVLIMAWLVVFIKGKQKMIKSIDKKSWLFLVLSGIATGLSWLSYYRALQTGPASIVVPIDKMSIWVTVIFSYIVLGEKLSLKAWLGLVCMTAGTFCLLI